MEIQELKTHLWKREMTPDYSGYIIRNQKGQIVCRILVSDYKNQEASEFAIIAQLIEWAPQLLKHYFSN